jgi:hypothetical protein
VQREAPDATVLIADQSGGSAVRALARGFEQSRVIASERGLSRGRNACLAQLPSGAPAAVLFPNDNTWYDAGVLAEFAARMGEHALDVLAGRLVYMDGSAPFPVPKGRNNLVRANAALAMSATLAIRSSHFEAGLRFDEGLGSGARSPYQAGEETDLVLRILANDGRGELHSDLVVRGEDATRALALREQIHKTWGYSLAHTYVLRRHGLSRSHLARTIVRPMVRALLSLCRLDPRQAVLALTRCLGRCRGLVAR